MNQLTLLGMLGLLVVVSGCSMVPSGPSGATPEQIAPGLSETGIEDPDTLTRAHGDYLKNHSYTIVTTETITDENGSVINERRTRATVTSGFGAYYFEQYDSTDNETRPTLALYFDGGTGWYARQRADGREIGTFSSDDPWADFVSRSSEVDPLRSIMDSFSTTVSGQGELNGKTLYYVQSTDFHDRYLGPRQVTDDLQYADFSANVDSEGVVHEYELTQTGTENRTGDTLTSKRRVQYINLGETTVKRPEWADE